MKPCGRRRFFPAEVLSAIGASAETRGSIILVSHAMTDVEQFCRRALLLHQGKLVALGISPQVVKRYYLIQQRESSRELGERLSPPEIPSSPLPISQDSDSFFWPEPEAFLSLSGILQVSPGGALCLGIALCDDRGLPRMAFQQGETAFFYYEFELRERSKSPSGVLFCRTRRVSSSMEKTLFNMRRKFPNLYRPEHVFAFIRRSPWNWPQGNTRLKSA